MAANYACALCFGFFIQIEDLVEVNHGRKVRMFKRTSSTAYINIRYVCIQGTIILFYALGKKNKQMHAFMNYHCRYIIMNISVSMRTSYLLLWLGSENYLPMYENNTFYYT